MVLPKIDLLVFPVPTDLPKSPPKSCQVVLASHVLAKSHVEASKASGQPSRASKSSRKVWPALKSFQEDPKSLEKVSKCFKKLLTWAKVLRRTFHARPSQFWSYQNRPHRSGLYSMTLHDYNASQDKGKSSLSVITTQSLKAFHLTKCIREYACKHTQHT